MTVDASIGRLSVPAQSGASTVGHLVNLGRLAVPAFLVGSGISLLVPVLAVWLGLGSDWRSMQLSWDGHWLTAIALHGYPAHLDPTDAFLPGYPLLVRAAMLTGLDVVAAGLAVSLLGQLVGLFAVADLVQRERGEESATLAVWIVALAPFAFFFSAVYTEGAFFGAAGLAIAFMRRGHLKRAVLCAAIAASIRLVGLTLMLALLAELAHRPDWQSRGRWLLIGMVPCGFVASAIYLGERTGHWLAIPLAEGLPTFDVHPIWPWVGAAITWAKLINPHYPNHPVWAGALVVAGVAIALLVAGIRQLPPSLSLYCGAALLIALSVNNWRSTGRYSLALFPLALVVVSLLAGHPNLQRVVIPALAAGSALGALIFASGHWLG